MPIKIIQWNQNRFYSRLEFLQSLIDKKQPETICLQKMNFKGLSSGKLKNYKAFAKNRSSDHASDGVAICIKDIIHSQEIAITSNLEVVATKVMLPTNLYICNIYLPNSQHLDEVKLTRIFSQLPKPFIITGDFNSHNILWGSHKTDTRGASETNKRNKSKPSKHRQTNPRPHPPTLEQLT